MEQTNESLEKLLAAHRGGDILDVASGDGGFAVLLARSMREVTSITCVDIDEEELEEAAENVSANAGIRPGTVIASAESLPFSSGGFDSAAISNGLHHLKDPAAALAELTRALRPGGLLIVHEMVADARTSAQENGRDLHHFKAEIDRLHGIPHGRTYGIDELTELLRRLPLSVAEEHLYEPAGAEEPYHEGLEERLRFIDDYLENAAGSAGFPALKRAATDLKVRLRRSGFAPTPQLLWIARR